MKRTLCLIVLLASFTSLALGDEIENRRQPLIGYTEFRVDLPGGRQANIATMRAHAVLADGTGRLVLADGLTRKQDCWTQFAGWSPDGTSAVIGRGWEDPENARWEEEHKQFRFKADAWLYDMYLLDMQTRKSLNLTTIDRVSFYNTGLFFWPNKPNRLGFQALIDGVSHPFSMDRNGRNKVDLTKGSKGFTYGFNASPDGARIAYHKGYQVYIANADGSGAVHIQTGRSFNFSPKWSPDGRWLMFLSGEHYDCHPHVVRRDGKGLRQIGDRKGYRGVVEFLDVFDYHGGSSDVPVWSADGKSIFYTAKIGSSIELMQGSLTGKTEQLTHSKPGSHNYQPTLSPNGKQLAFGSNRTGRRQLYIMQTTTRRSHSITKVEQGRGAMWPHWQPR